MQSLTPDPARSCGCMCLVRSLRVAIAQLNSVEGVGWGRVSPFGKIGFRLGPLLSLTNSGHRHHCPWMLHSHYLQYAEVFICLNYFPRKAVDVDSSRPPPVGDAIDGPLKLGRFVK